MTLRPPQDIIAGRPDGAVAFAGDNGNLMLQDGAKAVFRGGVTQQNGDFDVFQHDLVGDGDLIIPLEDVGGASLVNAAIVSLGDSTDPDYDENTVANPTNASRPFTVTIEDLAKGADAENPEEGDVLLRREPDAFFETEEGRGGVGIFSDNGRVVISHAGLDTGENVINASVNVQSGSTDALQIRGQDGTIQDPATSADFTALGDVFESAIDNLAASSTAYDEDVPVNRDLQSPPYEVITLDTRSDSIVDISLDGTDADVSYQLQTRPEVGADWFDWLDYTDTDRIRDTVRTGSRLVRLVVTSESANADSTATVALQSSG
jgi:hypothetical protein